MSLTQEQIDNISKNLSKLNLSSNNVDDINTILKYIELLKNVNTEDVKPTISVVDTKSVLREDEEKKEKINNELLKCSNQKIISNNIAISNIMK
ncbi:hypothetical protein CSA08_02485 [Candidatus Gracilibacteria bacterium]|nr:MAG: hypothetical protein CSA08_02485 [Candidatus Gracilibacteria bacterium]